MSCHVVQSLVREKGTEKIGYFSVHTFRVCLYIYLSSQKVRNRLLYVYLLYKNGGGAIDEQPQGSANGQVH
jgi:hypothetical protein